MARAVHDLDGYPVYLPDDLESFLAEDDALGAWVAERGNEIVGHVALHRRSSPEIMALAKEATGLPDGDLAVVARLMVAPSARRAGVGRVLLDTAASQALALGRQPVLDVAVSLRDAVLLYEAAGWARAGPVTVQLPRLALEELVFVGPAPG